MPLKLKDPRPGKSPNYTIRGTYLGVSIDRTTGTADRKKATKILNTIKAEIEAGSFIPKDALTFADAALSYLRGGGESVFLAPLVEHFNVTPLPRIDQAAIDEAAALLYPTATPATRNRQVYTPVSAILKHAKVEYAIKRPKGAQGRIKAEWMTPDMAGRLLDAAEDIDAEFRIFLAALLYTGLRLSELLNAECSLIDLGESTLIIPKTKNEDPRAVYLPPQLVAELGRHPRGLDRGGATLFRFRKNGYLYTLLKRAKKGAGLPNVTFHTFRHTWATWMRRYAKLDTKGLVGTGAWKDEKSASRYQHVVVTEEAQRADLLPVVKSGKRGKSVE